MVLITFDVNNYIPLYKNPMVLYLKNYTYPPTHANFNSRIFCENSFLTLIKHSFYKKSDEKEACLELQKDYLKRYRLLIGDKKYQFKIMNIPENFHLSLSMYSLLYNDLILMGFESEDVLFGNYDFSNYKKNANGPQYISFEYPKIEKKRQPQSSEITNINNNNNNNNNDNNKNNKKPSPQSSSQSSSSNSKYTRKRKYNIDDKQNENSESKDIIEVNNKSLQSPNCPEEALLIKSLDNEYLDTPEISNYHSPFEIKKKLKLSNNTVTQNNKNQNQYENENEN
ncbi:hypothetical protein ACTFIR_002647 [Dictyostelium discoideum]